MWWDGVQTPAEKAASLTDKLREFTGEARAKLGDVRQAVKDSLKKG